MKILKWLGLSILGFLLFISLTVFGIEFMVKSTVLNPEFIPREIDRFPVSTVGKQFVDDNMRTLEPEISTAVKQTITDMEPQLKEDLGSAVTQVYDYLLGKKPNPEVATTLRNTILSNNFINNLIDKTPVATIAANSLRQELDKQDIPDELLPLLDAIEPAFIEAEPDLKDQLKNAAPPILDYLLGKYETVRVTLDLQEIYDSLKVSAKEILMENPPSEFIGIPTSELEPYIDDYINRNYSLVTSVFPTKVTIDEKMIGTGTPAQISRIISDVETSLAEARPYIKTFQTYYIWILVLTLVLIAGIAAILRSVVEATRSLGSIFISYGIFEFGPLIAFRLLAPKYVFPEMVKGLPSELATFVQRLIFDFMSPLLWFSLGVLIVGIILMVVSFVYHPKQPVAPEAEPEENF